VVSNAIRDGDAARHRSITIFRRDRLARSKRSLQDGRRKREKSPRIRPFLHVSLSSSPSLSLSLVALRSLSSRLFTLQTRQRARSRSVPYPHCQNKWSPSSEVPRGPFSLSLSLSLERENQNRSHAETGLPRLCVRPSPSPPSPGRWKNVVHTRTCECRHSRSCRACAAFAACSVARAAARLSASGVPRRGEAFTGKYSLQRNATAPRSPTFVS